jgi:hypothetical protein
VSCQKPNRTDVEQTTLPVTVHAKWVQHQVSWNYVDERNRMQKGYHEVQNVCHLVNELEEFHVHMVELLVPGSR